jgi:hypothetical protein
LPIDTLARGKTGSALAIDSRNRFGWISLAPAHRSKPWVDLVTEARDRSAGADRQGVNEIARAR